MKLKSVNKYEGKQLEDFFDGKIPWNCGVCGKDYWYGKYFTPWLLWYRQVHTIQFCSRLCALKYILFYKKEHLDRWKYGNQTTIRRGLKNWFRYKILKKPLFNCRN